MKLELVLAFFQSKKMGVEPGSKSFDLNEGDQNSAGYKLQNKKVKHGSKIVRKNERGLDQTDCVAAPKLEFYDSAIDFNSDHVAHVVGFVAPNSNSSKDEQGLDPSPHELESAARKTMPKLEFYDSMLDLKSQNEAHAKAMELAEPVSHTSKDRESFMKFLNDKPSVKKSAISPIGTFQNSMAVTEYEPEMGVYYQGNTYHLLKELCAENGVLIKPSLMCEDSIGDNAYNCIPSVVFGSKEIPKTNAGNKGFNLPANEESENVNANHDHIGNTREEMELPEETLDSNASGDQDRGNDVIHKDEDVPENHIGNTHEEMELPEETLDSNASGDQDRRNDSIHTDEDVCENHIGNTREEIELPEETLDSNASGDQDEQFSSEPEYVSKFLKPKKLLEEGVSAGPSLGLAVEESNSDGTRSLSYHFEPSALADCGKKDCHHLSVCNCNATHRTFKPLEGNFVHGESSQIRNSLGEASFSALGPVSGRISYSGSIPYSGSISIRSESSTNSTRSFAFPILQSEYVSSPVRMGTPEKDCCFRKQSSWKTRLLCCKF